MEKNKCEDNIYINFCNECHKFPYLHIINLHSVGLKCDCPLPEGTNEEYGEIYNLDKIKETKYTDKESFKEPSICSLHDSKILVYHCYQCNIDLCEDCFLEHSTHITQSIGEIAYKIKIDLIKDKLNKAVNKIIEYRDNNDNINNIDLTKCLNNNLLLIDLYNDSIKAFEKTINFPSFSILYNIFNHTMRIEKFFESLNNVNNNSEDENKYESIQILKYCDRIENRQNTSKMILDKIKVERTINLYKQGNIILELLILQHFSDYIVGSTFAGELVIFKKNSLEKVYIKSLYKNPITNMIPLNDDCVIVCSEKEKTIKIVRIKTKIIELTNRELNNPVNMKRSVVSPTTYFQKNVNFSTFVSKAKHKEFSAEITHTYEYESDSISNIYLLTDKRLAICSMNKSIKIVKVDKDIKLITEIKKHNNVPRAVIQINNGNIISGSREGVLYFWNDDGYSLIGSIENVYCMTKGSLYEYDDNYLLVGGTNEIDIIDVNQIKFYKKIQNNFLGDISKFMSLGNNSDGIIGKGDNCFFVLDENFNLQIKRKPHDDYITCIIVINNLCFISVSADKKMKIWR